jgi:hypothetical protein
MPRCGAGGKAATAIGNEICATGHGIGLYAGRVQHMERVLRLAVSTIRSLQADMQAELRDIGRAVTGGTRDAGRSL